MPTLTLQEIYDLSFEALTRCGASKEQAGPTAVSVRDADLVLYRRLRRLFHRDAVAGPVLCRLPAAGLK